LRGFGQQFAVAPIVTLSLGSPAPQRLKLASGLFNLMRNLGGAIGIAACGTILNDRANIHFLHLAEHLNGSNSGAQALLSQVTAADASRWNGDTVHGASAALHQLWSLAFREAQTQAFADAFLAIMVCLIAAMLLIPLMKKVLPRAPRRRMFTDSGMPKCDRCFELRAHARRPMHPLHQRQDERRTG
jgi:DHA2 family multidrug resistance protein